MTQAWKKLFLVRFAHFFEVFLGGRALSPTHLTTLPSLSAQQSSMLDSWRGNETLLKWTWILHQAQRLEAKNEHLVLAPPPFLGVYFLQPTQPKTSHNNCHCSCAGKEAFRSEHKVLISFFPVWNSVWIRKLWVTPKCFSHPPLQKTNFKKLRRCLWQTKYTNNPFWFNHQGRI